MSEEPKPYDPNEPCPACGSEFVRDAFNIQRRAFDSAQAVRRGPPWARRTVMLVKCRACLYEAERAPLFEATVSAPPRYNVHICPGCEFCGRMEENS